MDLADGAADELRRLEHASARSSGVSISPVSGFSQPFGDQREHRLADGEVAGGGDADDALARRARRCAACGRWRCCRARHWSACRRSSPAPRGQECPRNRSSSTPPPSSKRRAEFQAMPAELQPEKSTAWSQRPAALRLVATVTRDGQRLAGAAVARAADRRGAEIVEPDRDADIGLGRGDAVGRVEADPAEVRRQAPRPRRGRPPARCGRSAR